MLVRCCAVLCCAVLLTRGECAAAQLAQDWPPFNVCQGCVAGHCVQDVKHAHMSLLVTDDEAYRAYTKRIQGQDRTWLAQQLQAELDSTDCQSCNGAPQLSKAEDQKRTAGGSPDVKELLQLRQNISAYQVSKEVISRMHISVETCVSTCAEVTARK